MDSPLGIRRYHACGHRIWQRIGAGLYASFVVIFNSLRFIFVQFHFGKDEVSGSNPDSSSSETRCPARDSGFFAFLSAWGETRL